MDAHLTRPRRAGRALLAACLGGLLLAPAATRAADLEVRILGADGAPVRDAVVSIHSEVGAAAGGRPSAAAIVDQRDRQFVPHVSAVERGTTVEFPNSDQIRHSIYSFSEIRPFEITLYKGFDAPPIRFDRPGVAVLGCNIHDYMLGFVYVLDTPHFGVSDAAGELRLEGLPAGAWILRVRHPRVRERDVIVERRIDGPSGAPLALRLDVSPPGRPERLVPPPDELQDLFGEVAR